MTGTKQAYQVGHEWHVKNGDNSQVQSTTQLTGFAVQLLKTILKLTKNGSSVLLKDQAFRSKQYSSSPALKERNTKTRFQVAHLLRHTRLRNAKTIGRPAETARLGHSEEVAKVPDRERDLHCERIFCSSIGPVANIRFCFHRYSLSLYIHCL